MITLRQFFYSAINLAAKLLDLLELIQIMPIMSLIGQIVTATSLCSTSFVYQRSYSEILFYCKPICVFNFSFVVL